MQGCTITAARHRRVRRAGVPAWRRAGTGLANRRGAVFRRGITFALMLVARVATAAPSTLVAVGDASPLGLPFSHFSDVALDEHGATAFVGAATVVFRRTADGIVRVVGAGDAVAGGTVAGVGPADLARDGCAAFRVILVGGGAGVFRQCAGTPEPIAATGQVAPGGGTFAAFGAEVGIGAGGRVAFTAVLSDGSTAVAFADGAGVATEVARTGGPSPGGGTFTGFRLVGVSSNGAVGLRGAVTGGRNGLFYWNGASLVKLALEGDASPAGGSFESIGFAGQNDAGVWAFRASRSFDHGGGVYRAETAGGFPRISRVVLQGDPAPIGGTFRSFPTSLVPAVNAGGAIAFRATLADAPFPSGVFVAAPEGVLSKRVAVGEPTAAGQLFRLRELSLDDAGAVLVRATLAGGRPGLLRADAGRVSAFALLGDATDTGAAFRFGDPRSRTRVEDALFLGTREGLFVVGKDETLSAVAALGERSPLGGVWAGFEPPAAGPRGGIVFAASVQGGRAGEGLFKVRRRGPRKVTRAGARVKGVGSILDLFSDPLDNLTRAAVGRAGVAFQAAIGGGAADSGILLRSARGLRRVALAGQAAPSGGAYRAFGTPAVLGAGRIAFVAEVGTNRQANLFLRDRGRWRTLATAGSDTGTRLGGRLRTLDTPAPAAGGVVFRAALDQAGREGIFFTRKGGLAAIAGSGDPAPGGGRFRSFAAPAGAGAGIVFRGDVAEGAAPGGLYHTPVGRPAFDAAPTPTPIAVVGGAAPRGGTFLGFGAPSGNRRGAIAFTADIVGGGTATAVLRLDGPP